MPAPGGKASGRLSVDHSRSSKPASPVASATTGDPSAASTPLTPEQKRIVEQNMPLVHHIVGRMTDRFPSGFSRDDLVQAGSLGLVEATRRYEADKGFAFSTFAGRRIEGAILDALRGADWASRSVRSGERHLRTASAELAATLGRQPTDGELMQAMGIDQPTLDKLRSDLSRARVDSLSRRSSHEGDTVGAIDVAAKENEQEQLEEKELLGYLRDAVRLLPERHRIVIVGYFLEGKSMTELGELLAVSQSRASQLKGEALTMMRDGLSAALEEVEQDDSANRAQDDYNRSLQAASSWRDRLITKG